MSVKQLYTYQLIAKTVCSSISLIFSGMMVFMIITEPETGLASPYSRIIFFLSIGDIIFSSSFILGPHLIPKDDPNGIWAKGNVASCDAVGFLQHTGSALNQLYTVALSYYFLKRVKDKVQPKQFAEKYEKYMHGFIWFIAIVLNLLALIRQDFNPVGTGATCAVTEKPINCVADECMRGEKADRDALLFLMPIVAGSFLLIISNFTRLTIHVYKAEELMRLEQAQQRNAPKNVEKYSFCKEVMKYFCQCCMCRKKSEEEDPDPPKRSLAFESFIQSSLWVAIYMLIYIPPVVVFAANARGKSPPKFVFWLPSTLTAIGGAFNIFTYTRPKIQKTRRVYPQLKDAPYWVVFIIVLFSGGECPKEIDFGSSFTNHSSSTPEPTPEEEEADAEKKRISQLTPSENEQALQEMVGDENIFSSDFWLKHFGIAVSFNDDDNVGLSELLEEGKDSNVSMSHNSKNDNDVEDSTLSFRETFHEDVNTSRRSKS